MKTYRYDSYNNITDESYWNYDTLTANYDYSVDISYDISYQNGIYTKLKTKQLGLNGTTTHVISSDSVISSGPNGEPVEVAEDYFDTGTPGTPTKYKFFNNGYQNWVNPRFRDGNVKEHIEKIYRNGSWVNYHREFTAYSGNTNMPDSVSYEYADSTGVLWLNHNFKYVYTYNGNQALTRIDTYNQPHLTGSMRLFYRAEYSDFMPLGLAVSSSKTGLSAYPNPFNNTLIVNVSAPAPYTLTDLSGKALMQGNLQPESGRAALSTETLPAGMYLLHTAGSVLKVVKE